MNQTPNWLQKLLVCSFLVLASTPVTAQITPDNTLGAESSRLTPNVTINGAAADRIDGGATRGSNLFHSFSSFNIDDGQKVYFGNPSGIQNILTRVTGGKVSNILGTLGVDGGANLFLINPSGIIFGQNGRLDLRGSFVGTTANAIGFGDLGFFSATNPAAPPLLTVNPSALLYTQINRGAIANFGSLTAQTGQSLVLAGGDIDFNKGSMAAQGGRIELAAIAGTGTVGLNADYSLSIPTDLPRADIALFNSEIGVTAGNNSGVAIHARNLDISGNSLIYSQIGSDVEAVDRSAGDISLDATDTMQIKEGSLIANVVFEGESGKGGNINVTAGSLSLTDGAEISASTLGIGDAGSVFVQAKDFVSVAGNSYISSDVESGAKGKGGNINLTTGSLSLSDGARISASTLGEGDAGSVSVQAKDFVSASYSAIFSNVEEGAKGNGGNINITAPTLSLTDGGQLSTFVREASNNLPAGEGIAGNVNVNVSGDVTISGGVKNGFTSGIFSFLGGGAKGKGGSINLTTGSLFLTDGAQISASTFGIGDAGSVSVQAKDSVSASSSAILSNVEWGAKGNGGNINITAATLSLTDGAQVQTLVQEAFDSQPAGEGIGGNVNVNVSGDVTISGVKNEYGSGILSSLGTGAKGKGGNINLTTGSLSLTDGAQVDASTSGIGDAGSVSVQATDSVSAAGNSYITSNVEEGAKGNGGNINITAPTLSLTDGGQLSTIVREASDSQPAGFGIAGNVFVDVSNAITISGVKNGYSSGIFSSLGGGAKGKGGNINLTAGSLSLTDGARIFTSSYGIGDAGSVSVQAKDSVSVANNSKIFSNVASGAKGNGGNINFTTGSLSLTDGAQLIASTYGIGDAGNITIDARDTVKFDGVDNNNNSSGAYSTVEETGVGNAGNIKLTTGSITLTNGGQVSAGTFGQGNAGDITIDARDAVTLNGTGSNERLSGVYSTVGATGVGKGGNIRLTSNSLSLNNNAYLSAVTAGKGDAGNIFVQASDLISLSNSSYIFSNIFPGGVGNSGSIDIDTRNLTLTDGSQISAAVFRESGGLPGGKGRGGEVRINATESVTLSGISPTGFSSGILAVTERGASGDAGNITVNTGNFRVADGAVVSAATFNDGNSGNVTINANNFEAVNGGQVANVTSSSGNAGAIRLNVRDSVTLAGSDPNYNNRLALVEQQRQSSGSTDRVSDIVPFYSASGIFASTSSGSTGQGGSIFIDPPIVTIRDGAKISVNSDGTGNAGNITLQAGTLTLDNRASISAQTASSTGGNINIDLGEFLLLRRGSQISTTAGTAQAGGDGGNITINSPFIIALPNENSDITANAFEGRGGNVQISTQGIFGIQPRSSLTQLSDITATSERNVQGQIDITEPNVQPEQGLVELPGSVLDASDQIAQVCPNGATAARPLGKFVVTGRGSLPPNPLELLAGTTSLSPLASIEGDLQANLSQQTSSAPAITATPTTIVEAQGWVKTAGGKIALVAHAPQATPTATTVQATCPVGK